MGTGTPATGGVDSKSVVKNENRSGGRHNNNCRGNNFVSRNVKFQGAEPNLCGHVFEAKHSWSDQVANYKVVDEIIRVQVGTECDPYVLNLLENEVLTLPDEPDPPTATTVGTGDNEKTIYNEIDKMKWKSQYDR